LLTGRLFQAKTDGEATARAFISSRASELHLDAKGSSLTGSRAPATALRNSSAPVRVGGHRDPQKSGSTVSVPATRRADAPPAGFA